MGGLAAGSVLLLAGLASAAPPLDYAGEVARATQAMADGDPATAVEAWAAAEALSGGNLDTLLGPVPALVELGRHREAAARAREGTDRAPDLSGVWMTRAWSTRFRPWLPQLGAASADRSYRRALALAPDRAAAWCGLGWTRLQEGDTAGARAAHEAAVERGDASGCARAGLDALPPRLRVDAGVGAGGSMWSEHPWRSGGWGMGAWASAADPGVWSVSVTANRLVVTADPVDLGLEPPEGEPPEGEPPEGEPPEGDPPDDGGGPPPADEDPLAAGDPLAGESDAAGTETVSDLVQTELWLAATGRYRWAQVLLVGGRLWTTGYAEGTTNALGARLSFPVGVTPSVEIAGSQGSDGSTAMQLGGGVTVPLWRGLWVEGGGQWTRVGGELADERLGGTGLSAQLGTGWSRSDGRGWARIQGRLGDERRPVRLDEPGIWNVDDTLLRSVRVTGGGQPMPWLGVFAAVEGAALETFYPPEADPVAEGLETVSTVWIASGGLSFRPVGAVRRGAR